MTKFPLRSHFHGVLGASRRVGVGHPPPGPHPQQQQQEPTRCGRFHILQGLCLSSSNAFAWAQSELKVRRSLVALQGPLPVPFLQHIQLQAGTHCDCHGSAEVQWSDFVGLALWLIGFGLEATADLQKYLFKQDPANKGHYIDTGARCYTTSSACVKQAARLLDARRRVWYSRQADTRK